MPSYCVFITSRPLLAPNRPSHIPSAPNFPELSPLLATHTRTSHKSELLAPLTPFFSPKPFHSVATLFTLKPVSPVFATLTKSTPGYTPHPTKVPFPIWNSSRSFHAACSFHRLLMRVLRDTEHSQRYEVLRERLPCAAPGKNATCFREAPFDTCVHLTQQRYVARLTSAAVLVSVVKSMTIHVVAYVHSRIIFR
jgi:hypothetical protein